MPTHSLTRTCQTALRLRLDPYVFGLPLERTNAFHLDDKPGHTSSGPVRCSLQFSAVFPGLFGTHSKPGPVFFAKLPAFSAESLLGLSASLPAFSAKHGLALQLALAMHLGIAGPEYQMEKPPQQQQ